MGVWLSRPQPLSHSRHTCVNQGDKAFSLQPEGKWIPSCKVQGLLKAGQPFIFPRIDMYTWRVLLKINQFSVCSRC